MNDPIKAGDELAFHYRGFNEGYRIFKVDRITPSGQIVCGHFRLNPDLTIRGRSHGFGMPHRGEPVTDKIREECRRARALRRVKNTNWEVVETSVIEDVLRAVGECMAPKH